MTQDTEITTQITTVTMPQLGESVHEATISKWLVKPGDQVEEFEPMLEVDTDKVSAEVPSPVTGTLKEILASEGQTIQAGAEIATVATEEASTSVHSSVPSPTEEKKVGKPVESPSSTLPTRANTPHLPSPTRGEGSTEHRFSPAVLMLAQEHNLNLDQIQGSGIGGRVTKKDLRKFIEQQVQTSTPSSTSSTPSLPSPAKKGESTDERIPLNRVRRLIAENMVQSKTTIPHAWQTQEVDMSGVVANRAANKKAFAEHEGFSLTYLPYVVAAAVGALREHPAVNATFGGDHILVHGNINVGISVGLEDTLVVPVIQQADSLSLAGIARAVNRLATKAREGKLAADDLSGGTFTVNNSGTFGTLFSYSVISPGQAGILTMEAIVERPVAVQGMLGIKPMMYLCFSFDHRVLDGLQAARFLTSCRTQLEAITAQTSIY